MFRLFLSHHQAYTSRTTVFQFCLTVYIIYIIINIIVVLTGSKLCFTINRFSKHEVIFIAYKIMISNSTSKSWACLMYTHKLNIISRQFRRHKDTQECRFQHTWAVHIGGRGWKGRRKREIKKKKLSANEILHQMHFLISHISACQARSMVWHSQGCAS